MKISTHTGIENKHINRFIILLCVFILFAGIKVIVNAATYGSNIL